MILAAILYKDAWTRDWHTRMMDFRMVRQKMATTQYALLAHTCSHRTQHSNNPADSTAHGTSVTWKHRPPSTVKCRHQPKVGRFRCISGYVPNRSHRGPAAAKHGWFWDSRQVEDGSVAGSGSQPNRMWDRKDRAWTQSGCCVNSTDCHTFLSIVLSLHINQNYLNCFTQSEIVTTFGRIWCSWVVHLEQFYWSLLHLTMLFYFTSRLAIGIF